jgi:Cu/Ag efflux pump CusA
MGEIPASGRLSLWVNVAMAPIGGLLALLITHTNFSVSSGVGFLALFGVSVQTGVILHCFTEETFRRSDIASFTQQKVYRSTQLINRSIGVSPTPFHFDIGLITTP